MRRLILDAGPLIGLFWKQDPYQEEARRGFEHLNQSDTNLITPVSIVFEVYKWLLYKSSPASAQEKFTVMMNTLVIQNTSSAQLEVLYSWTLSQPDWKGSLEDASVILLAQEYNCPLWTINYRDFSRFSFLNFWNP